jgi:hypothetical protein
VSRDAASVSGGKIQNRFSFFFVGFCLQGGFAVWGLGVLGFCIFIPLLGFGLGAEVLQIYYSFEILQVLFTSL